MDTDFYGLKDDLVDKDKTLHIVRDFLELVIPSNRYPPGLPADFTNAINMLAARRKQEWENNINLIFEYAESPIEKIFLNTLVLYAIGNRKPQFAFTIPLRKINSMMESYRTTHKLARQIWLGFLKDNGIAEENADRLVENAFVEQILKSTIDDNLKRLIIYNIKYAPDNNRMFHISIQSTFDDILLDGKCIRPDVLIWVPSEPTVKIIIECDGFDFHSSKSAFINDRARDRLLLSHGFKVLRFSGSEIVNDPVGAAGELYRYLLSEEFKPFVVKWWLPFENTLVYNSENAKYE